MSEPDNRLVTTTEPKSDISVEESPKEDGETPTVPSRCSFNSNIMIINHVKLIYYELWFNEKLQS